MKNPLHLSSREFSALEGRIINVQFMVKENPIWLSGRIDNLLGAAYGDYGAVGSFNFYPTNEAKEKAKALGFIIPTSLTPLDIEAIEDRLEHIKGV